MGQVTAVLLRGFDINWQQNKVTRQLQFRNKTHMVFVKLHAMIWKIAKKHGCRIFRSPPNTELPVVFSIQRGSEIWHQCQEYCQY